MDIMKNIINTICKSIYINKEINNIEQDFKKSSVTNILLMLDYIKNRDRIYKDENYPDLYKMTRKEKITLGVPYILLTMIELLFFTNEKFLNNLLGIHIYITLVAYFLITIISSYFTLKTVFLHLNEKYLDRRLVRQYKGEELEIKIHLDGYYLIDYEKRRILKKIKKNENLISQAGDEQTPRRKRL